MSCCRIRHRGVLVKHNTCFNRAVLVLVTLFLTGPEFLFAADLVKFNSASTPPTPFQIKRAKAQGKELKQVPGTPIHGLLYRPTGTGPFPGVVLLHDCRGIQTYQKDWALELASWGYVALLVDSFGPRNFEDICADYGKLAYGEVVGGRLADAFGAHAYLKTLPFIDESQLAVLGWTGTVLSAVFNKGASQGFEGEFRAAVAFHPHCPPNWGEDFGAPLLVLIGESDDSVKPDYCRRMGIAGESSPIEIEVILYPGVFRSFDDPNVGERLYLEDAYNPYKDPAVGVTLGYSPSAHQDARNRVKAFLARHLE